LVFNERAGYRWVAVPGGELMVAPTTIYKHFFYPIFMLRELILSTLQCLGRVKPLFSMKGGYGFD